MEQPTSSDLSFFFFCTPVYNLIPSRDSTRASVFGQDAAGRVATRAQGGGLSDDLPVATQASLFFVGNGRKKCPK